MSGLQLPVSKLTGIGKVKEAAFAKLSIFTLSDLLYHFPTRYENRGHVTLLVNGTVNLPQSYILTVATEPKLARLRGSMTLVKFRAFDDSGSVEIGYFNVPYMREQFHVGETYRFYGRLTEKLGRYSITNPVAERCDSEKPLPSLYAVYRLASPLNKNVLRACEAQAYALCKADLHETLPSELLREYGLAALSYAIKNVHAPENLDALSRAARRLAFDELLETALAVRILRARQSRAAAARMMDTDLAPFYETLSFALTKAQQSAIEDVKNDLSAGSGYDAPRMSRILIGDVGCGKTVCAAAAIFLVLRNGYQALLMAPTEILAAQHYESLYGTFRRFGYTVELLTGSTTAAEKRRIKKGLTDGTVDFVIGTHALIEDDVVFRSLGLAVADEQHRFGIKQRAGLIRKNPRAHMLVMTATPIPRTLSLVLYGDLAVSRIGEMPPGRQKVDTFFVNETYRPRLNAFIDKQVAEGGQVYVVCPAVEPPQDDADEGSQTVSLSEDFSDEPVLHNAVEFAETLAEEHKTLTVAYIHGRMKPSEKNEIMTRFAKGEIHVLVSTTVIEVGINVPRATLMIVENAERFGLSQLHQLRGRVGRGEMHSYCVLVSDSQSENAKKRLKLLCRTNDGFEIAEEDLKMRGPGDFLGTDDARQSGEGAHFRMAALCSDPTLPTLAGEAAEKLLARDPNLESPELYNLRARLARVMELGSSTMN